MKRTYNISENIFPVKEIGYELRMLRHTKNMTIHEIAAKTPLSHPTVNNAELGRKLTFETLICLTNFYDIFWFDFLKKIFEKLKDKK